MRQPVRIEGSAAGSTTVNSALRRDVPGRQRRPDQLRLDRGGALIGCEQDREGASAATSAILEACSKPRIRMKRRVERDFRHRRQHAHQRPQQRLDGAVAGGGKPERHADHDRDARNRQTAETAWSRRACRNAGSASCWASRANTAAGGGSSDGGAMPALARPCQSARIRRDRQRRRAATLRMCARRS